MDTHKKNIIIFFYTYFSITLMITFVNVYLPVYFFNVLIINQTELAFVQIFAYSAYFVKPVVAIFFDKRPPRNRLLFMVLGLGLVVSFIFFIFEAEMLVIFGIFLGINFAFASILDVLVDKQLIEKSEDIDESLRAKRKNIYIGATQLGALIATIILSLSYFIMFSDLQSLPTWNAFFILGVILVIPLPLLLSMVDGGVIPQSDIQNNKPVMEEINRRNVFLLCIFGFLWGSSNIFQYPFEPWIVEVYGEASFSLYSLIMTFIVLIYAISVIVAIKMSNLDQKKTVVIGMILAGILYVIAPFSGYYGLIICMAIIQVIAGFVLINYIAILIKISNKRVAIYQLVAVFTIVARVILVPLGTYLYGIGISGGQLLTVAGVMFICSAVPMFFITSEK